jgi:hypothetical protein
MMKFPYSIVVGLLALVGVEAFAIPPQHIWMVSSRLVSCQHGAFGSRSVQKSLGSRAYYANPVRREGDLIGGEQ